MPFSSDALTLERDGAVATLWLDRPDRLNAMNATVFDDLPRAFDHLVDEGEARAVVVAGRGDAFSAGLDLKTLGPELLAGAQNGSDGAPSHAARSRHLREKAAWMQDAMTAVAECPLPVVAAVHGACIGAGMDLITACDVRLAATGATFSVRETRMAMVADLGTLQRLPAIVGQGVARELVFTGRDIDAGRAAAVGLVNDVHEDAAAAVEAARELAREIAANSPLAVQGAKTVMNRGGELTTRQALDYVTLWNAAFLHSDDLGEAVGAFMQKREPEFTGE